MATIRFIGSGDAFGSGGRLQACILIEDGGWRCLLDCGASSLIGLKRAGIDPASIDAIVISHLHGDHFGGLPFFLLDAQFNSHRSAPVMLAGHSDLGERLRSAMHVLFPGSEGAMDALASLVVLDPSTRSRLGPLDVEVFDVEHFCGSPPFAVRVTTSNGAIVGYTGDTGWTDSLYQVAEGVDLLIAESYFYDKKVPWHLDYATLAEAAPNLGARRIVVTHLSADLLGRLDSLELEVAHDGLMIELTS